jgi:SAM-dependent methyltransferase
MQFIKPENSFRPVQDMLTGVLAAKALEAAVELKVFDAMEETPLAVEVVAQKLGLVAERLEPLLDILEAGGILRKEEGKYANTPRSAEFLVSTSPLYQGMSMKLNVQFCKTVEDSLADFVAGKEMACHDGDKSWSSEESIEGMAQYALGSGVVPVAEFVAELPGFEDFRAMCDIGGNHGLYTMAVLDRNEFLRGAVCDLPPVAEQLRERAERFGFGDRVEAVGLDFRTDDLPAGPYDLVLTSHILYAFREDVAGTLRRIAENIRPGGWFISHHYARNGRNEGRMGSAVLELQTRMCGYPSHFIEREELEAAFADAGFADFRFQAVPGDFGLIGAARKAA